MAIQEFNFPSHRKGDTFDGKGFQLKINDVIQNITDWYIEIEFRKNKKNGQLQLRITNETDGGITVSDAVNGLFEMEPIDGDEMKWNPADYYYDIQTTNTAGIKKSYLEGILPIHLDVTIHTEPTP